ncbi:hypothetical protein ABVK25_004559 [Lepraria finkii]|uniref:C2H2-type domain-containing protein n=1 Tax=Lepraria finkii TaxID=1340010 RepID=A0ABR4BDW6_9LECA
MAMSGPSKSAASDTNFRKTWDRTEYAAKAEAREAKYREEGAARAEAKAAGQKYRPRASTPPDAKETGIPHRPPRRLQQRRQNHSRSGGAATGKRGRGAGFYCADCDLTFKDNLQFVEHLNSKQHQIAIGQSGEVKRATLEEVRERLEWLGQKRREKAQGVGDVVDLGRRLEVRKEVEEREREEKRARRREKRRKTEGGVGFKGGRMRGGWGRDYLLSWAGRHGY